MDPDLQPLDTSTNFKQDVRRLIQQSESNLKTIDAEIARLHSLIDAQYRLRELERHNLASLRAKIAPIRKLPVELLAEIFVLSLQTDSSPFCVSHVSQHWRRVAHSIPRLWHQLSLKPPQALPDGYLDLTKAWIDRSSPLPLSTTYPPQGPISFRPNPFDEYSSLHCSSVERTGNHSRSGTLFSFRASWCLRGSRRSTFRPL